MVVFTPYLRPTVVGGTAKIYCAYIQGQNYGRFANFSTVPRWRPLSSPNFVPTRVFPAHFHASGSSHRPSPVCRSQKRRCSTLKWAARQLRCRQTRSASSSGKLAVPTQPPTSQRRTTTPKASSGMPRRFVRIGPTAQCQPSATRVAMRPGYAEGLPFLLRTVGRRGCRHGKAVAKRQGREDARAEVDGRGECGADDGRRKTGQHHAGNTRTLGTLLAQSFTGSIRKTSVSFLSCEMGIAMAGTVPKKAPGADYSECF